MKRLERFLERKLQHHFHKNRTRYIEDAVNNFITERNPSPETLENFKKRLNDEADRVYAIVDRSVLRARIKAASKTFWIGSIASVIIIGVLSAFTGGTALALIPPVLGAFVAWLIYVGTSKYFYNQRVKAGLDTVLIAIKKDMDSPEAKFDAKKYQQEINQIQSTLVNIIQRLDSQQTNVPMTNHTGLESEIEKIKGTLNALIAKVDAVDHKLDNFNMTNTAPQYFDFFNQATYHQEDELFKQMSQLFLSFSSPQLSQNQNLNSPIQTKPTLYVEKKPGFFQPVSSIPLLKAIETDEVYQFHALITEGQRNFNQPLLKVLETYTTQSGLSLLHYAASYGSNTVIDYLLRQGMNADAKTASGETALDIAIKFGYKDAIIALAKYTTPSNDPVISYNQLGM